MNKLFKPLATCIIFILLVSFPIATEARPLALTLSQVSPSSCPSSGCAAGQRINARASYSVNPLVIGEYNTQVCVYTIQDSDSNQPWADATVFDITDLSTYKDGELNSICTVNLPAGSVYLGGAYAWFESMSSQVFDFAFRINKLSTNTGYLRISIYRLTDSVGDIWTLTDGPSQHSFSTAPGADSAYVAPDVATCGTNSPCYLNSGDDLANGIGTGLKDAVDARATASTINILGSYPIKSNSVNLNTGHILQGMSDATLTYTGTTCSYAMLLVTAGATIQDLNINDGGCTSPSRDLVLVDSPATVVLHNNDLVDGKDAVSMLDNFGDVSIRFNRIVGNSGYGIFRTFGANNGTVKVEANNIHGNRSGTQVECNTKGVADHNYWGNNILETSAISNCIYTTGKRLGAAIITNSSAPGVVAQKAILSGSKTGYFGDQISVSGTNGSVIILVNHGVGGSSNIPFLNNEAGSLTVCSNFWDIFISDDSPITPTLINLYMKYNQDSDCISAIESVFFCGGSDQARYPLLWYDPMNSVTNSWDATGQIPSGTGAGGFIGQTTNCNLINKEISVSLDNNPNHKPNLLSDLNYTPFVVEYPGIIAEFIAIPGITKVDLQWETSKETNIKGYYVVRSLNQTGPYYRDSALIFAKGDADIGGIYNYTDMGLNNGTTYWYKLELIDINNLSVGFSTPISTQTYSMMPTATEITPASTEVYGPSISVDIFGNNFIPSSMALWDNNLSINLSTSYIDSTHLTAIIPGNLCSDPDSAAVHNITVYNPGPGGGTSPPLTFTIKNPVPYLNDIDLDLSDGNITPIIIKVSGEFFVRDSSVRFNGSSSNVTTTFVDWHNLTASIPRSNLGSGILTITVFNPTPGGGTSLGHSFNMYTPTPTLTRTPTSTRTSTSSYKPPVIKTSTRIPTRTRTPTPIQTITGTIVITNSVTPGILTTSATILVTPTSELPTSTPSLAPGEPTYTPVPPVPQEETGEASVWTWRLLSALRVFAGSLLGAGLLALPAFFVFRRKTRNKTPR